MLRNPVDVMYAQHNQLIFNVIEDIPDFAEALAAEPERRAGRRLPPGPINVENLFYRHSVRFAEQLERYFDVFGRERVHVMLFDDLTSRRRARRARRARVPGRGPVAGRGAAEGQREPARRSPLRPAADLHAPRC